MGTSWCSRSVFGAPLELLFESYVFYVGSRLKQCQNSNSGGVGSAILDTVCPFFGRNAPPYVFYVRLWRDRPYLGTLFDARRPRSIHIYDGLAPGRKPVRARTGSELLRERMLPRRIEKRAATDSEQMRQETIGIIKRSVIKLFLYERAGAQ